MSERHEPVRGSFRDPAGRLYERDGVLERTVDESFSEDFTAFLNSGLYEELVGDGLLVAHEEIDPTSAPEPCWRLLRPDRIPIITYPWEWGVGQLRAAALLTLELQGRALERGLVLRDASAFNVQFRGHRPVHIDTLSFGRLEPDRPWAAYGQFCRHFLAPLALRCHVDPRLADLQLANLDGIPLDLASRMLPRRTWLSPGLGIHVHWHARASGKDAAPSERRSEARFGLRAMQGLVEQLRSAIRRLTWDPPRKGWAEYEATADHYDRGAADAKAATVARWLTDLAPGQVLDVGANIGRFSRVAAELGADVVALDGDHAAVEVAFRRLVEEPPATGAVLPLRADLANPSPAAGWAHTERLALSERVRADVVLALAVVHHLTIVDEVPLAMVLEFLASLGDHLILEWIPPDDPKVRQLLSTREARRVTYTQEAFEAGLAAVGRTRASVPVAESGRMLFLVESR